MYNSFCHECMNVRNEHVCMSPMCLVSCIFYHISGQKFTYVTLLLNSLYNIERREEEMGHVETK